MVVGSQCDYCIQLIKFIYFREILNIIFSTLFKYVLYININRAFVLQSDKFFIENIRSISKSISTFYILANATFIFLITYVTKFTYIFL